ncbi:MAG: FAD-dependent monooxygenase [Parvibaculaceae bacterium]|nr:FAD-dependent monooxygenase [Parvibaculaceae bacterium]
MEGLALVVGAGPVGLTMAGELARYGVHVRLIDKAEAPGDKSKALVVWSRTLELLNRTRWSQDLLAAGLEAHGGGLYAGGRRLARLPLDNVDSPHPYALMVPQDETERVLAGYARAGGVEVERGVTLESFAQDEAGVSARLVHPDGRAETVRAQWLIGCDGAHSTVRHGLGLAFEGKTEPDDWMLADVMLDSATLVRGEPSIFLHQDGVLALFPIGRLGRFRIIADMGAASPNERRADPTLEDVQALVHRRGLPDARAHDPFWLSTFRINERKVHEYGAGRVLLAGDAAHIHSPAGGQGMNTGMQDAFNLAWKLALVCRSGAGPSSPLIASYSEERSAIGDQVLKMATGFTRVATLRNPVLQALRNKGIVLADRLFHATRIIARNFSETDLNYSRSRLNRSGEGVSSRGLAPGMRVPGLWRGEGDQVTALFGTGAVPRFLLIHVKDGRLATDLPQALAGLVETVTLDDAERRHAVGEGDGLWLIRPDGYLVLHARAGDWAVLENWLAMVQR